MINLVILFLSNVPYLLALKDTNAGEFLVFGSKLKAKFHFFIVTPLGVMVLVSNT
jgi:hypothetical protein